MTVGPQFTRGPCRGTTQLKVVCLHCQLPQLFCWKSGFLLKRYKDQLYGAWRPGSLAARGQARVWDEVISMQALLLRSSSLPLHLAKDTIASCTILTCMCSMQAGRILNDDTWWLLRCDSCQVVADKQ